MNREKRLSKNFCRSKSGMTSTEFALIGALLAAVTFLSVREIGGAMSDSMMTMAENVGDGGSDPAPYSDDGSNGAGDSGAGAGDGNTSPSDPSSSGQPAPSDPSSAPPASGEKKKKDKKKKKKKKKKK